MVYDASRDPFSTPRKNFDGYVYEHVLVAEHMLGRKLSDDEVVHHLDGDRGNNHPSNLLVLLRSQHVRLHEWLKSAAECESLRTNPVNCKKPEVSTSGKCLVCGAYLDIHQRMFCSKKCSAQAKKTSGRRVQQFVDALKASNGNLTKCGKALGVSASYVVKLLKSNDVDYKAICSQARESSKSSVKVQRLESENGINKLSQAPGAYTSETTHGGDIVQEGQKCPQT